MPFSLSLSLPPSLFLSLSFPQIHKHAHARHTHTHTHSRTHARTHTHMHTRTHARARARTHTHTHTHTHVHSEIDRLTDRQRDTIFWNWLKLIPILLSIQIIKLTALTLTFEIHGDVAQLVRASDRHAADAGSIPRCGKGSYSQSQLSVQTLLRCPYTPACAIACIYICAHVKDPVVHVRVRWIMESLKHAACSVGWVAQLYRSWLSLWKNNPNFQWEKIPMRQYSF